MNKDNMIHIYNSHPLGAIGALTLILILFFIAFLLIMGIVTLIKIKSIAIIISILVLISTIPIINNNIINDKANKAWDDNYVILNTNHNYLFRVNQTYILSKNINQLVKNKFKLTNLDNIFNDYQDNKGNKFTDCNYTFSKPDKNRMAKLEKLYCKNDINISISNPKTFINK